MAALVLPHWSIYMYLDVFSNQKKSAVVSRFHVLPVFLWSFECVLQTFYVPVLALHGTFNSICQDDFRPIVRGIWICRRTRNDANYEVHSWHRAAAVASCMSPIKRALVLLRVQTFHEMKTDDGVMRSFISLSLSSWISSTSIGADQDVTVAMGCRFHLAQRLCKMMSRK